MSNLSLRTYFAAAAFAACLPLATYAATATAPASTSAPAVTAVAVPGVNLPDFTTLVDKVGPSVVNIRTTTRVSSSNDLRGLPPGMDDGDMSEFFRRFFGIPMPGTPGSPRGGGGSGGGNGGFDDELPAAQADCPVAVDDPDNAAAGRGRSSHPGAQYDPSR